MSSGRPRNITEMQNCISIGRCICWSVRLYMFKVEKQVKKTHLLVDQTCFIYYGESFQSSSFNTFTRASGLRKLSSNKSYSVADHYSFQIFFQNVICQGFKNVTSLLGKKLVLTILVKIPRFYTSIETEYFCLKNHFQ